VKSYAVVLETQVYDKAIKYLGNVQADLMKTLKVSQDKSKNDKEEPIESDQAPEIVIEEKIFEPIRRSILNKPLRHVFNPYRTVPISLQAIPS